MARQKSNAKCLASFIRKVAKTIADGERRPPRDARDIDITRASDDAASFDIGDLFDAVAPVLYFEIGERHDDGVFFFDHNHAGLMFDQE
jgi:hypothetical protein